MFLGIDDTHLGQVSIPRRTTNSPVAIPSNRDKTRMGRLRAAGIAGYNLGASCNIKEEVREVKAQGEDSSSEGREG